MPAGRVLACGYVRNKTRDKHGMRVYLNAEARRSTTDVVFQKPCPTSCRRRWIRKSVTVSSTSRVFSLSASRRICRSPSSLLLSIDIWPIRPNSETSGRCPLVCVVSVTKRLRIDVAISLLTEKRRCFDATSSTAPRRVGEKIRRDRYLERRRNRFSRAVDNLEREREIRFLD